MTKQEEKYFLNIAGEYAVCSELAKRNIQANLTLGNKKAIDIIVLKEESKAITIEVKTTNKNRIVTNFFQKYIAPEVPHPDIWVIVIIDKAYQNRFFVLTHYELAQAQMKSNKVDEWKENKGGVDNIPLSTIVEFENKWDKI
jgi:hypothetical protein